MFRTNDHSGARRGFSLAELIIAMSIAAIVSVALISAYLFLGRNLTRSLNTQRQEVESRRAVQHFTKDFSAAIEIARDPLPTATLIQITKTSSESGDEKLTYRLNNGSLERHGGTFPNANPLKLASGLVALNFTYFNEGGTIVTARQSIKSVELSFTSVLGSSSAGTLTRSTTVSPRVVLRNKQPLL